MSDFSPEAIYRSLLEAGEAWAHAEAAASILEETKKTYLSKLMAEEQGSNAERERLALAREEYTDHIGRMVNARKEANKLKVRFDAAKVLAELRRTQESTRRIEQYQR